MEQKQTQWILLLSDKVSGPLQQLQGYAGKAVMAMAGLQSKLEGVGKTAMALNHLGHAMQTTGHAISGAMRPLVELDSAMQEVQMITGLSGDALKALEGRAIGLSKTFGGPASAQAAVFTGVLSDLGPQVAANQDALSHMADSINKLGLTMKGDVVGAQKALTTAVNVFGDSTWDSAKQAEYMTRVANVMAAGQKEGNVTVSELAETMNKSAGAARAAGLSIEELVAVSETLGKLNIKGAEGGTAVRNVLLKTLSEKLISKDALESLQAAGVDMKKVQDTTLPLIDRLNELKKVGKDMGTLGLVFGTENVNAAAQLLNSTELIQQFQDAVTGTTELERQSAAVQESIAKKMGRVQAQLQALQLSVLSATGEWGAYLAMLGQLLPSIGMALPALGMLSKGLVLVTTRGLIPMARMLLYGKTAMVTLVVQGVQRLVVALGAMAAGLLTNLRRLPMLITQLGATTTATTLATGATRGLTNAFRALNLTNPWGWLITGIGLVITFRKELAEAGEKMMNYFGVSSDRQNKQRIRTFAQQTSQAMTELGLSDTDRKLFKDRLLNYKDSSGIRLDGKSYVAFAESTIATMQKAQATAIDQLSSEQLKQLAEIAKSTDVAKSTRDLADSLLRKRAAHDTRQELAGLGGLAGAGGPDPASDLKGHIAGVASHSGVRHITINIHDGLVKELNVITQHLNEGVAKVRTEMERVFTTIVRDTEVNLASN
jgi:TP901 family phage tail tape measure protein